MVRGIVDYAGPLAFLIGYFATKNFLTATWWLVGASTLALVLGFVLEKRLAPMPAFTGLAALVFGMLTLVFKDATFLKMKPTFINLVLSAALLIGWMRHKSPLKFLLGDAIQLSRGRLASADPALRPVLLLRRPAPTSWSWRTQSDATWVLFRMPGLPLPGPGLLLHPGPWDAEGRQGARGGDEDGGDPGLRRLVRVDGRPPLRYTRAFAFPGRAPCAAFLSESVIDGQ